MLVSACGVGSGAGVSIRDLSIRAKKGSKAYGKGYVNEGEGGEASQYHGGKKGNNHGGKKGNNQSKKGKGESVLTGLNGFGKGKGEGKGGKKGGKKGDNYGGEKSGKRSKKGIGGLKEPSYQVTAPRYTLELNLNGDSTDVPPSPTDAEINNLRNLTEAFYLPIFQAEAADVEQVWIVIDKVRHEQAVSSNPTLASHGVKMDLFLEFEPLIVQPIDVEPLPLSEVQRILTASQSDFERYIREYVWEAGENFQNTTEVAIDIFGFSI